MNEIKALKKRNCASEAALFTLHVLDHSLYSARPGLKHLVALVLCALCDKIVISRFL